MPSSRLVLKDVSSGGVSTGFELVSEDEEDDGLGAGRMVSLSMHSLPPPVCHSLLL